METAQKHTPEALKDYLIDNAIYAAGHGQVTLEDAAQTLSLAPSSVVCQLCLLHENGFLSALKIGGRDGEQVFYQIRSD